MESKAVLGLVLMLLLTCVLTSAVNIQPAKASGTIYIRADGSIDPPTAPIQRDGDIYNFTDDIVGSSIVIEKNNMVLDGCGYIFQGPGTFLVRGYDVGLALHIRSNVTIKNLDIMGFSYGIHFTGPSYNALNCNIIRSNIIGILFENWVSNIVTYNFFDNNSIAIFLLDSWNNTFHHNDFMNNTIHVLTINNPSQHNFWDDGYPSGGNYWSDYTGVDEKSGPNQDQPGWDGIGDTPHGADHYPLMTPCSVPFKAAQLAKQLIGFDYNWGGKGWSWSLQTRKRDWSGGHFLTREEMRNGYTCMYSISKENKTETSHQQTNYKRVSEIVLQPKPGARFHLTNVSLEVKISKNSATGSYKITIQKEGGSEEKIVEKNFQYTDYKTESNSSDIWVDVNKKVTIRFYTKSDQTAKVYSRNCKVKAQGWYDNTAHGVDCSGLVFWSYNKAFNAMHYPPWDAKTWTKYKKNQETWVRSTGVYIAFEGANLICTKNVILMDRDTPKEKLRPGDLLFFNGTGKEKNKIVHVAMYVGDYYYKGGNIKGIYYPAGTYDVVNAKNTTLGIIPDNSTTLTEKSDFFKFGRVKFPVTLSLKEASSLGIKIKSPADLEVTDPLGYTITKDKLWISEDALINETDGASLLYLQIDENDDGKIDGVVLDFERQMGDYLISVVPKPDANPSDTYTLEASYENTTIVLAENVPVANIPSEPYTLSSNETGTSTSITIDAYCNTEGVYISVPITMDGSPTGYNTPHTFTGLTGTHTFTVPSSDANGHPFKQWSTGSTSTTITVSSGTYTAYYQAVTYYSLTISTSTGGTTNPSPGTYSYQAGTVVTVTAIPDANYKLDHWELDGNNIGSANPISITMNTNHNLHAVFIYSPGVGGIVIPVDKLALLTPYIGLASTIVVAAVATVIYVKRVKHRKEKQ
jgi:cell wall-associated NlpC family hydrolase